MLSRWGAFTALSEEEVQRFHGDWKRHNWIVLPRFFDRPLLEDVRAQLRGAEFYDNIHSASGHERAMKDNKVVWLLDFLMNVPVLLRQVAAMTATDRIHRFDGRVYQLTPGTDEGHDWHDDRAHGRRLGVSVNLTAGVFEGGMLQLRDAKTHAAAGGVANTGEGDCVIFRLGEDIQHRVLPVTGTIPRVAYAGWFSEGPTQLEALKGQ
jgi:hypothetical protein